MAEEPKKSALPDLSEVTSMAGKLYKDVKKSVVEIYGDYKSKRKEAAAAPTEQAPPPASPPPAAEKPAEKPAPTPEAKAPEPKPEPPAAEASSEESGGREDK